MTSAERPWSATVRIEQVGETGRHVELEASEATRAALAKPAGVDAVERLDVDFAPPRTAQDDDAAEIDIDAASAGDEPEPLIGNVVDLGLLATEFFILGIDPYPRAPGVAFDAPKPQSDAAANPFAALAALQKKGTVKE
jgi:hypothetical protein